MLVAFYTKKATRVGYQNKGKVDSKIIGANIWTVIEDITDVTQISNMAALSKAGVSVYSASFRTTPPFGQSHGKFEAGKFAVIPAGTDSTSVIDLYSEYLSSARAAAKEVKNALFVEKVDASKINFSKVDFSKVDWRKVDFGKAAVYAINLSKVDFTKIDFSKVDWRKASDLLGISKGAKVMDSTIGGLGIDMTNVDFSKVDLSMAAAIKVDSRFLDFSKVDWRKVDFSKVEFIGLNFDKIDLKNFDTTNVIALRKVFPAADFSKVDFTNLDFGKVDFAGAGLLTGDYSGYPFVVDLSGVDFSALNFSRVNFDRLDFIGL
jgi:uncharacterized protein YjbI with pentapeptide repeats